MPGIPNSSQWSKANKHYWEVLVPSVISGLKTGDIVFAINDVADHSPKYGKSRKLKNLSEGILSLSRDLSKKGVDLAFMHGYLLQEMQNASQKISYLNGFKNLTLQKDA